MDKDHAWYLDEVERIELSRPNLRVVEVSMPCHVPEHVWNVEETQMRGHIPITGKPIPGMRRGIFGNYRIVEGPFVVKFNDGSVTP